MSDTPIKDNSFLDALTLQSSSPRVSNPDPTASITTPQGEFQSLSLGITSPAASKVQGGVVRFVENSIQVTPGARIGDNVVHITAPEMLCCGLIGNTGTKFCIRSSDCKISTHTLPLRKHTVSKALYILDKRSSGCLIHPNVDTNSLDASVINRLLTTELEGEELRREFILIESQEGSNDNDIDTGARSTLKKAVDFKTPLKSKLFQPTKLNEIVSELYSINEEGSQTKTTKFESKEEELMESITAVSNQSQNAQKAIPQIADAINNIGTELQDKTDLIHGNIHQVKQLEGAIGVQSNVLKGLNMEPTVWGSLADLLALVQKSDSELNTKITKSNVTLSILQSRFENVSSKTELENVKSDIIKLLQSWKLAIETLTTRVTNVESNQRKTKLAKVSSSSKNAFHSLGISDSMNNDYDSDMDDSSSSKNEVVAGLVKDITSRITKLEKQQTEHGKDGLNGAVRFSGVTFSGKQDVGAWLDSSLETTGGIPPYGLFADPQLLLHWVWILLSGTTNSSARDMKDRISIEMSQDKTYAVDSYQHYIPLVFTGKKSSLLNTSGMDKSRLAQIPTFESWDDATGENGLKQQIAEGLALVRHSISDLIEETFENAPEVRAFALSMLHTSSSFIENLGTYMSETYNNFKDVVGNEKSVWGLVTFVVEQLFRKDFGQVRAKTIGAIDANNRTSGIKIIWSSIRCVDVAQQFMSHGIKNAPAVSASYVRFVITHSNMGKVANILEENKKLKRRLDELETDISSMKKTLEGVKRVADQAMSKASGPPVKKKKKTEGGGTTDTSQA
jgi:hypothetical protein